MESWKVQQACCRLLLGDRREKFLYQFNIYHFKDMNKYNITLKMCFIWSANKSILYFMEIE